MKSKFEEKHEQVLEEKFQIFWQKNLFLAEL